MDTGQYDTTSTTLNSNDQLALYSTVTPTLLLFQSWHTLAVMKAQTRCFLPLTRCVPDILVSPPG